MDYSLVYMPEYKEPEKQNCECGSEDKKIVCVGGLHLLCTIFCFVFFIWVFFVWIGLCEKILKEIDIENVLLRVIVFFTILFSPTCVCIPLGYLLNRFYFKTNIKEEDDDNEGTREQK